MVCVLRHRYAFRKDDVQESRRQVTAITAFLLGLSYYS